MAYRGTLGTASDRGLGMHRLLSTGFDIVERSLRDQFDRWHPAGEPPAVDLEQIAHAI
jgi:hypothetical protein